MKLDWRTKGLPPRAEGCSPDEIGRLGLNLLSGDLMMPAAVVREGALRRNIAEMQAFADRHGACLCPHGKTSMSPELFRMQMETGAWGLTAATAHHVRIYRKLGIGRIFLANSLLGRTDLDFVMAELAADPGFELFLLVDSAAAVDALADAATRAGLDRPLQLLVETGVVGGRAGVRTLAQALDVAHRVADAAPRLALRGVETFEGIHQERPDAAEMIDLAVIAAHEMAQHGLFAEGEILVSAGGSGFLDLCAARLPAQIKGRTVRRIIRPGCYVTHDHGAYEQLTTMEGSPDPGSDAPAGRVRRPGLPELEGALEVWGPVLSVPEPQRAIIGVGKRDVSYDSGPPRPLHLFRPGRGIGPEGAEGMSVERLWDQHLALAVPPGSLAVGDLIGFGVSHPCATFDRWTALLTVDDGYRVTGALTTLF